MNCPELNEDELFKRMHKLIRVVEKEAKVKFDIEYLFDHLENELSKNGTFYPQEWREVIIHKFKRYRLKKKATKIFYSEVVEVGRIATEEDELEFVKGYLFSKGYERKEDTYTVPWKVAVYTTVFLAGGFLFGMGTLAVATTGVGVAAVAIGGELVLASFLGLGIEIASEYLDENENK